VQSVQLLVFTFPSALKSLPRTEHRALVIDSFVDRRHAAVPIPEERTKCGTSLASKQQCTTQTRRRLDASIAPPSTPTHPHARLTPGKQLSRKILPGQDRPNPPRKKYQNISGQGTRKLRSRAPWTRSHSLSVSLSRCCAAAACDRPANTPACRISVWAVFSHRLASDAHPQHQQNMTVSASIPPVRPAFDT